MEIDDMPKEEFAAIRRQAMGKMNSSESSHFNLPQKNISSLTLMKLVFMSIICVLLVCMCNLCIYSNSRNIFYGKHSFVLLLCNIRNAGICIFRFGRSIYWSQLKIKNCSRFPTKQFNLLGEIIVKRPENHTLLGLAPT